MPHNYLPVLIPSKLYFLLSDSPTSFSEEDEKFRNFFDKRYETLGGGSSLHTPAAIKETKKWLADEVFLNLDEEQEEIDEEEEAFEDELARAILGERNAERERRALAFS